MSDAEKALAEAERVGLDLSLVDSNLRLSIDERLWRHDSALELVLEMRRAGKALHAQTPPVAATAR